MGLRVPGRWCFIAAGHGMCMCLRRQMPAALAGVGVFLCRHSLCVEAASWLRLQVAASQVFRPPMDAAECRNSMWGSGRCVGAAMCISCSLHRVNPDFATLCL
jgi:hypothetical protein